MFERALPTSTEALQALASSLIAELARKDELLAMREQRIGQHEQQIAQHVQSIEERDRPGGRPNSSTFGHPNSPT
ncbi:MAG: hypothetical protein LC121_26060 [Anaerolineae bacterium]|nr:hypothetical protein [Anaerolineae bacterium]